MGCFFKDIFMNWLINKVGYDLFLFINKVSKKIRK